MNFVEELQWRGMVHTVTPGVEQTLAEESTSGYLGIDPTADSLHIGHLVGVMMLRHYQRAGHRPIALIGGATGMIGDPSMKSAERTLLDETTLRHNQAGIQAQLSQFLDFDISSPQGARLVNNYDWMKEYSFLGFIRDIGKHITVNYMMAKDSVKKRLSGESGEGMSFTEFSYQLLQGYDYLYLYEHEGCRLQMGGSDQWGNITTGTELIRRKVGGVAYGLTCPLITKADGGKFGKTESGNIWLDASRTTPYAFYQFWLNVSDADAGKYIRIFTDLDAETIGGLEEEAKVRPSAVQRRLAKEVTVLVHSERAYESAKETSRILFEGSGEALSGLGAEVFAAIGGTLPRYRVSRSEVDGGVKVVELLVGSTGIFGSKGEVRKLVQNGGLSLNGEKVVDAEGSVGMGQLVHGKYMLVRKGKKVHYLIELGE
jgi:tyrosyl-tRNA synthetase